MRRELIVGERVVIALERSGIGHDAVVIDDVEVFTGRSREFDV